MSAKGYWKWRVLHKRNQYRFEYRRYWWPFWKMYYQSEQLESKKWMLEHLSRREEERIFRKTKWEVVEEGSWPE
jgi:hypothetical protein